LRWLWKGVSRSLWLVCAQGRDRGVEAVRIVFDQAGWQKWPSGAGLTVFSNMLAL
jgi:hypothetical protein